MAAQRLAPLVLSDDERAELQSLTMRRKTAQALALRARIVLACAEGGQNKEVAAKLGVPSRHLLEWIEGESFWLFCPGPADELVGCEAFESFVSLGEVVGVDEV